VAPPIEQIEQPANDGPNLDNNPYAALVDNHNDDDDSEADDNEPATLTDDESSDADDDSSDTDDGTYANDSSTATEENRSDSHEWPHTDDDASDAMDGDDDSIGQDNRSERPEGPHTDTPDEDNRSECPDGPHTDTEHTINVDSLEDANIHDRVRRELRNLSDTLGNVVTTSDPFDDTGKQTRSGQAFCQHATYAPITPSGIALTTTNVTTQETPLHLDMTAWEREYGEAYRYLFTQYSMKKGLKIWGNRGLAAVRKEMEQFDYMSVMDPVRPSDLSPEERDRVLEYLMFLKEKRCGKIKGRGCADGRKQRLWTAKHDASSPTAFLESLFLTSMIDAKERRKVVTVDIPGAFLHTEQDELVHVRITDEMATLLATINPDKYETFLTHEGKRPVLYGKLNKCLYGTLKAALQFWTKLRGLLIEWGYKANPYDPCVMNKTVNGKQITVLWHVDDLKISCEHEETINELVSQLDSVFGTEAPLTAQRGFIHEYLGMTLDFSDDGKVKIIMDDYLEKLFESMPDDGSYEGTAPSPAASNLFDVRDTAPLLDESEADFFHSTVARLLFLGMRARPDIMTAISFLTTRVSAPTVDDRNKLRRVIRYLRDTKRLHLTLEPDEIHVFKWMVDASFAVHPNMRSHTGCAALSGKGSFLSISTKQKLNTKSSTEAELVGVDDIMGRVLWTKLFMAAQGYETTHEIGQDNQSAMLLEKNGQRSSSKRTRHLNIRYFFITDCIQKGQVHITYVPTKEMIGDFYTKPLQGYLFRKLRAHVMNLPLPSPPISDSTPDSSEPAVQECVGDTSTGQTDRPLGSGPFPSTGVSSKQQQPLH